MYQPDLFTKDAAADVGELSTQIASFGLLPAQEPPTTTMVQVQGEDLDLPAVLERLAGVSARPRYTYMVLNLIARAASDAGSAGPHIREGNQSVPVRDWLSNALMPMAQRDARRLAIVEQVRVDLHARGLLPADSQLAKEVVAAKVRERLRHSGRTNVSRAVSDLVRAGLIRRHYQGFRVDHENRGAQREAVYTIAPNVRRALGKAG